jgi:hypothetical protein
MALMFGPYFGGGGLDDIFPIPKIVRNILNERDCPNEYHVTVRGSTTTIIISIRKNCRKFARGNFHAVIGTKVFIRK